MPSVPRLLAVPLAAALAAAVLLPAAPPRRVAGTPTAYCTDLRLLFGSDEEMWRAAEALRTDPRVREVREPRTRADNHRLLTGASDPQGIARTPASLRLVEDFGVDPAELADQLRREHRVNLTDACLDPPD